MFISYLKQCCRTKIFSSERTLLSNRLCEGFAITFCLYLPCVLW